MTRYYGYIIEAITRTGLARFGIFARIEDELRVRVYR